jgi:hypothetical protein
LYEGAESIAASTKHDNEASKSGANMLCLYHFVFEIVFRVTAACTFWTAQCPRVFRAWGVFDILPSKRTLRHSRAHSFTTDQRPKVIREWGVFYFASRAAACTFWTAQRSKVLRTLCVFNILTWQRTSRHSRVHFFLQVQKCFQRVVLLTFWLGNVPRPTDTCIFWSFFRPDGSALAALASLLFDPPEPQIIGKTQCFATFRPFRAPGSSFFWLFLFLIFFLLLFSSLPWLLQPLLFHLSILSEVWLLNFLR